MRNASCVHEWKLRDGATRVVTGMPAPTLQRDCVLSFCPQATTVSELVKLVARTLQLQGMEGVPGVNDKTWETAGPLGALQRVLGMTTTQLAMLFGQNEDAGKQLRAAQLKLEAEKDSNSKLQVSRTTNSIAPLDPG